MSEKAKITESVLYDIADAIRQKNFERQTYLPSEMPAAIDRIRDDATLKSKTVTQNGVYTAVDDEADGYSEVTVNLHIPTKVSELENDSGYLTSVPNATTSDAGIVKPDGTTILVDQDGTIHGAQANVIETVKVNGTALTPDANKAVDVTVPTKVSDLQIDGNVVTDANYVHTDNNYTTADKSKLAGIAEGAQANVIEVVRVNGTTQTVTGKTVNLSVAELGQDGYVLTSQLPSFVDDVVEYDTISGFPATGESGKIYIDLATNMTYRWSGSTYVMISQSLALGETDSTAYRGDRGKVAYDHAQAKGNAYASGLYKVTTNSEGHVTGAQAVSKADITALGIPAQDTTYGAATSASDGLMSASDKTKLDGIEAGAQVNDIEHVKLGGTELAIADKTVNVGVGDGLQAEAGTISLGSLTKSSDGPADGPISELSAEGWATQFSTTGKNLWETKNIQASGLSVTKNADGTITINGTATQSAWLTVGFANALAAGTYTLSGNNESSVSCSLFALYNGSAIQHISLSNVGAHATFNAPNGITQVSITVSDGTTLSNVVLRPQLELGSTATEYEPYTGGAPSPSPDYPQEIEVARGRNLFNGTINNTANSADVVTANQDCRSFYFKAEPNTTYTISRKTVTGNRFRIYSATTEPIVGTTLVSLITNDTALRLTFTTLANTEYVYVYLANNGSTIDTEIQAELGSTPQPYVPYGYVGMEVQSRNLWVSDASKYVKPSNFYNCSINLEVGKTYTAAMRLRDGATAFLNDLDYGVMVAKNGTYSRDLVPAVYLWKRYQQNPLGPVTFTVDDTYISPKLSMYSEGSNAPQVFFDNYEFILVEGTSVPEGEWPKWFSSTTTPIPLPERGWVGSLPDGTADILHLDGAGKVEWEKKTEETTTAATDGVTGTVGTDVLSTTGQIADGATVLYKQASVTESLGYIDLPDIEDGSTVSIPELENLGVTYLLDPSARDMAEAYKRRADHEHGEELATVEDAVAELAETVAEHEQRIGLLSTRVDATRKALLRREDDGYYDNQSVTAFLASRFDGKVYGYTEPKTSAVVVSKTGANAGLPNPSLGTLETEGYSVYRDLGPFQWHAAKGYVDADGVPHVKVIRGVDSEQDWDACTDNVWSLRPVQWWSIDESDPSMVVASLSDTWHQGMRVNPQAKLPDGTLRPYMLAARHGLAFEDGVAVSKPGLKGYGRNVSHNSLITQCATASTGYSGKSVYEAWYDQFMFRMIYGTKNSQAVMYGCANYNYQYKPTVAETGVKRVILSNANAANLVVGSTMMLGKQTTANTDRSNSNAFDVFDGLRIASKEAYDASNTAVYFDTEETFDTATGYLLSTAPWHTGSCGDMDWDGTPTPAGRSSGREPMFFQGCELMNGNTEVLGDVIISNDGTTGWVPYVNFDSKDEATNVTSAYVSCVDPLPTNENDSWKYPLYLSERNGLMYGIQTGGSQSVGLCDGHYTNKRSTVGTREWQSLGHLWYGGGAGLSSVFAYNGLAYAWWAIWSRLSGVGRSRG